MGWTFTVVNSNGLTKTAALRNPEFNDADRSLFRQARGTTDAGVVYVQDLDDTDQYVDISFGFLTTAERGAIQEFFGRDGTLRQALPFSVDIAGTSFPQKLKAGMTVGGVVVQAGSTYQAGDFVKPDTSYLREVYLDQDELTFQQERDERFSLDLRLRIHNPG